MKVFLGLFMALVLMIVAVGDAHATLVTYFVSLYGSVDESGGTNLLGHGTISIDPESYTMNWAFDVPGVNSLKQASIRMGSPGSSGPMVVRLRNDLMGTGLRDADLASIVLNPHNYYVLLRPKIDGTITNIRSYRGIRGQLATENSVPEPASLTLLGLGLVAAGLGWVDRRHKRA